MTSRLTGLKLAGDQHDLPDLLPILANRWRCHNRLLTYCSHAIRCEFIDFRSYFEALVFLRRNDARLSARRRALIGLIHSALPTHMHLMHD